jgi:hypothetical protein
VTIEEKNFMKQLKRSFWSVAGGMMFTVIIALTAFYFNTQSTLKYQQEQMNEIKCKIDMLIQIHLKNE